MKHILNVVKTESPQRRLKPDTNISTKMCKTENEIITVRQSSGLASCFSTILYFYIKAKEEFNNFVFARIDGAEAELLRKRQRNLTKNYNQNECPRNKKVNQACKHTAFL